MSNQLANAVVEKLYSTELLELTHTLQGLLRKQQELDKIAIPVFTYKGELFGNHEAYKVTMRQNRLTWSRPAPQIAKAVKAFVKKRDEVENESGRIHEMVRALQHRFPHPDQIKELLPAALHQAVDAMDLGNDWEKEPPEAVMAFAERNADTLSLVAKKLAKNLIME